MALAALLWAKSRKTRLTALGEMIGALVGLAKNSNIATGLYKKRRSSLQAQKKQALSAFFVPYFCLAKLNISLIFGSGLGNRSLGKVTSS